MPGTAAAEADFPAPTAQADSGKAYLEKHKINSMLETLLTAMIKTKPERPIQYLIDSLTFDDPDDAIQDSATGLNRYRLKKLTEVFRNMDKDESGNIDFAEMKAYGSKFGLAALSEEELKDIFREFDASGDHKVSLGEFVLFFSRTLKEVEQEEFDNTIKSMLV